MGLTDEQIKLGHQELEKLWTARTELEVSLAAVTVNSDGSVRIEIPRYREEGARLFRNLCADLAAGWGTPLADQFQSLHGQMVKLQNHYLGERSQEYIASLKPDGMLKVVHTSQAGEGTEPALEVTTVYPRLASENFGPLARFFPKK